MKIERFWESYDYSDIGRCAPHTPYRAHANLEDALKGVKSGNFVSLDGTWRFKLFDTVESAIEYDGDLSAFTHIKVPANIENQGFLPPIYTNAIMPFDYKRPNRYSILPSETEPPSSYQSQQKPPFVPDQNPTAIYVREFEIAENQLSKNCFLTFDGVEAAAIVYINGGFAGYTEDSKVPAEFEISKFLKQGTNQIKVIVLRWCKGTWLEDQDYLYLFGIYRPVNLVFKNQKHIQDIKVTADMHGKLKARVSFNRVDGYCDATVHLSLYDGDKPVEKKSGKIVAGYYCLENTEDNHGIGKCYFDLNIQNPKLWSDEIPNLYKVVIEYISDGGEVLDVESIETGFRTVEIKDGVILLNGNRLIYRGVNRHEYSYENGRSLTVDEMEKHIEVIKSLNINAVRTSHYPNAPEWYELCNKHGIILVCEANLETHAIMSLATADISLAHLYVKRMSNMVLTYKNYPCILSWSLGNESGTGANHAAMANMARHYDKWRFVQSESGNPGKDISDIRCPMYPRLDMVEKMVREKDGRPIVLCEYYYQLSNTGGGLDNFSYFTNKYKQFQGGFIWDFHDKAFRAKKDGVEFAGYALDFGDDICEAWNPLFMNCNGIVTHDLIPKPSALAAKNEYSPVKIIKRGISFYVENQYKVLTTEGLAFNMEILEDGKQVSKGVLNIPPVAPKGKSRIKYKFARKKGSEYFINFTVCKNDAVMFERQYKLRGKSNLYNDLTALAVIKNDKNLSVNTETGNLQILSGGGLVVSGYTNNFTRGVTGATAFGPDNTVNKMLEANGYYLKPAEHTKTVKVDGSYVSGFIIEGKKGTTKIKRTVTPYEDGYIFEYTATIPKENKYTERAGFGLVFDGNYEIEWYGREGETYPDRKDTKICINKSSVSKQHFAFPPPSENSGHEDTRYIKLTKPGVTVLVTADSPFHFDARSYSIDNLLKAKHDHEISREEKCYLNLDVLHAGIGGEMAWSTALNKKDVENGGTYSKRFFVKIS